MHPMKPRSSRIGFGQFALFIGALVTVGVSCNDDVKVSVPMGVSNESDVRNNITVGVTNHNGNSTVGQTVVDDNTTSAIDIQMTYVRIPPIETYYVCQQFKVPDDTAYHVTKFEPVINNSALIHHMLLFGCEFEMEDQGPHPCDSLDYRCRTWLVKWDVGMQKNIVMPAEAGVRIGQGSFKYLLLQIHWNNPRTLDDQTDASGMRLHVTKKLRPYDIGNVQIGQNKIEIPGASVQVAVSGACPASCTGRMLPSPIYITAVYLHMHGLGTQAALDVQRDREIVDRVAYEQYYNYTQPVWHHQHPPAVVQPGDHLQVTCWYDSKTGHRNTNNITHFGQGSKAEMCYAFIQYYPRVVGFDQCIQNADQNINC